MRNQVSFLITVLLVATTSFGQSGKPQELRRAVTVTDAIEMSRLGNPAYFNNSPFFNVANFSPDGKQFIVILAKGDLTDNTNQYSLLLFKTSRVFSSPKPELLLPRPLPPTRGPLKYLSCLDHIRPVASLGE